MQKFVSRPFRFTFILAIVATGTALAAVGGWKYARASAPVPGPIILISLDALRADRLNIYGYAGGRTPSIDTLAKDGVVFERAYSHAVQTLPAHVSLLSGRLPFETGVRGDDDATLKARERLLGQMLRDRGYRVGAVVSADVLSKESGFAQGYDFFDAPAGDRREPFRLEAERQRDGAESEAIAERWLGSSESTRLFLFLHLNVPQTPDATADAYDDEVAYADELVGRVVRYLKTHQLYDQSTIVLTADHGEGLGDHDELAHGLFVYDEAIHVPLVVKQAGGVGAGRRVRDVVQHIDIVPTILDLAKAPGGGALRGRSLKPLLEGTGQIAPQPVYSEAHFGHSHFGWPARMALTDGSFRYIKAAREELYDLRSDPEERENLIRDQGLGTRDQETATVERLRTALDRLAGAQPLEETATDASDEVHITERYRSALSLAAEGKWASAIVLLQQVLRDEPQAAPVWNDLALLTTRAGRLETAVDAYQKVVELKPSDARGYIGAAGVLLKIRKLDDAREQAAHAETLAGANAELLAESRAIQAFAAARVPYDQGKYEDALPLLEQAGAQLKKVASARVPDLHLVTADTFDRLDRDEEAEAEFFEELRAYPRNARARAALASFYIRNLRTDEAAALIPDIVKLTPTSDAYSLTARLWTMLGERKQAEATRAEARRLFPSARAGH